MNMNQDHYEESESTPAGGGEAERERGFARNSRRGFLRTLWGAGTISAAASLGLGGMVATPRAAGAADSSPPEGDRRRHEALEIRVNAARVHWSDGIVDHLSNGDEDRYADKRASFFKCLPQNHLGEVDQAAYSQFLKAMENGDPSEIEAIPMASAAGKKLANPQAAFAFDLAGLDSHATGIPPAPRFASAQKAAEIGEVYWQALTRDIPFTDFKTDHVISAAVEDLNRFSAIQAPTEGRRITANTLFRSGLPGDLIGPYISQFLWLDVPYGPALIKQRYATPIAGEEFITDYDEWLAIQRGAAPIRSIAFDSEPRYIYNGRGLGQYVGTDVSFQAFLNAALIINGIGPSCLDPNNPYLYSANQGGFVTFGAVDLLHMVTMAARLGLEGAWFHKWLVHRGARPEVFAGRIENQLRKRKNYGIHPEILHSEAVDRVRSGFGTALLPQAYPEGSPTHPAYPAGHSAIAGACATVLKAFVDEDFVMPDPVQASSDGRRLQRWAGAHLTLGHEINKLAGNISIGRCTAGVHYRSDGAGLEVGEAMAIGLLQDYSRTYNEYFDGLTLTKFDNSRIHIVDGEVNPL
jgi:hypothetical protein